MKEDLRIAILRYFKEQNHSTEEHPSNEWLQKQHADLGTIRRAIIELIDEGFLIISNTGKSEARSTVLDEYDSATYNTSLTDEDKLKKSSKRLIMDLPPFGRIKEHKFITTVKGIRFLIDFDKLKADSSLAKWQRFTFWPLLIFSAFMAAINFHDRLNKSESSQVTPRDDLKIEKESTAMPSASSKKERRETE